MADDKELENSERISRVEAEIHIIGQTLIEQKEEHKALFAKLFDKIESHVEKKPISLPGIIAVAVGLFTMFGLTMGGLLWMINASIQPLNIQTAQTANILTALNNNIIDVDSKIQLTNKEVATNTKQISNNADTMQWILFQENIPKQITSNTKDIEYLRKDVNNILNRR